MGDRLSTPTVPNPNATPTTTAMSSSQSPPTQQQISQPDPTHQPKSPDSPTPPQKSPNLPQKDNLENQEKNQEIETSVDGEGEEADEGECGFCLFMKGGGCREVFIEWEKCVEDGEKNKADIVEKCFGVTSALKKCMEAHPDYYGPILNAEKEAEEEVVKELEKQKEKEKKNEADGSALESVGLEKAESS